jgi:hypothetical protein
MHIRGRDSLKNTETYNVAMDRPVPVSILSPEGYYPTEVLGNFSQYSQVHSEIISEHMPGPLPYKKVYPKFSGLSQ